MNLECNFTAANANPAVAIFRNPEADKPGFLGRVGFAIFDLENGPVISPEF